jgi:hypothetical protein
MFVRYATWAISLGFLAPGIGHARGDDLDQPPINYAKAPADNAVSRLQKDLAAGKAKLKAGEFGYLESLLAALDVPKSSQVLIFSKTSFQRHRIGPKTPRAVYFNDEVSVGYCQRGDVLEVAAADPNLGTVFYTLDQDVSSKPRFTRQTDNCLACHGSGFTRGYPGHLLRSVFTDNEGQPVLNLGTTRVDHTTPLADRWGGWYVTGTGGTKTHRGNQTVPARSDDAPKDNPAGVNVTDLKPFFTAGSYLTPHSDLVALLVLEHQLETRNRITRAGFDTRIALYQQAEVDKALGKDGSPPSESTRRRIAAACEPLVKHLLFCEEAPLAGPVTGTSGFAAEFVARGPKDNRGRSLRDFDLTSRIFKYPCSYLVYSKVFDGLPVEAKAFVYRRLWEVLSGQDTSKDFAHLSAGDRTAIREILRDTQPGLPAYWK